MATNAQVQAQLAAALASTVDPDAAVAALDLAIFSALQDAATGGGFGPYAVSLGSDGTSTSFASLADMQASREYYRQRSLDKRGGMVVALPEAGWVY